MGWGAQPNAQKRKKLFWPQKLFFFFWGGVGLTHTERGKKGQTQPMGIEPGAFGRLASQKA